ncbi:hypothetical protein BD779DRAFT_1475365 [Infundibulicybe gibba]|nr:hypothetical protein BD779DRAFT_1475365 [Infundibulicybe gibba]
MDDWGSQEEHLILSRFLGGLSLASSAMENPSKAGQWDRVPTRRDALAWMLLLLELGAGAPGSTMGEFSAKVGDTRDFLGFLDMPVAVSSMRKWSDELVLLIVQHWTIRMIWERSKANGFRRRETYSGGVVVVLGAPGAKMIAEFMVSEVLMRALEKQFVKYVLLVTNDRERADKEQDGIGLGVYLDILDMFATIANICEWSDGPEDKPGGETNGPGTGQAYSGTAMSLRIASPQPPPICARGYQIVARG